MEKLWGPQQIKNVTTYKVSGKHVGIINNKKNAKIKSGSLLRDRQYIYAPQKSPAHNLNLLFLETQIFLKNKIKKNYL